MDHFVDIPVQDVVVNRVSPKVKHTWNCLYQQRAEITRRSDRWKEGASHFRQCHAQVSPAHTHLWPSPPGFVRGTLLDEGSGEDGGEERTREGGVQRREGNRRWRTTLWGREFSTSNREGETFHVHEWVGDHGWNLWSHIWPETCQTCPMKWMMCLRGQVMVRLYSHLQKVNVHLKNKKKMIEDEHASQAWKATRGWVLFHCGKLEVCFCADQIVEIIAKIVKK